VKIRMIGLCAVAILVFALAFSASAPAAPNGPGGKSVPAISASQPSPATANPEPHPEIREAIASLRRAKEHMEHAAHDFGGHRVEAIRATDEAIHQLETCLKFDK
jgi:hypothetical protein